MVGALRARTSDRTPGGPASAIALAALLAPEDALMLGEATELKTQNWDADLAEAHGALALAAAFVREHERPVLCAAHCSIAIATLPVLPPDVRVLWLDAHGDFHTPATTESGFLGGMPLAAACGLWDAGDYGTIDPARVLMAGVRDCEESERGNLADAGLAMISPSNELPVRVLRDLSGEKVFVHLDCDVVDPSEMPAAFSAPGGISLAALHALCAGLGRECTVVGAEITAIEDPAKVPAVADCVRALLA